jgi:hypothetical protein
MITKSQSRRLIAVLSVSALLAGACADTGDAEPGDAPASAPRATTWAAAEAHAHLMPMPGAQRMSTAGYKGEAGQYNFTYRGGAVLPKVKVVTVYWNASIQNQSGINGFYQAITQSSYLDWLSEYNTSKASIGRGSFAGAVVDTGAPAGTSLSDQDIQTELARLLDAGALPAPDPSTLYMVYFPAGVSISMDSNQSCQQFCAYHGTFKKGSTPIYYGVMPDFSGPCASCGGGADKLQNTTIVSAHELIEAITDPGIGLANASNDASFLGWYDDQGGEIGDVCQTEHAMVAGYAVQKGYSQQAGQCVAGPSGGGGVGGSGGTGGTGGSGGGGGTCAHPTCNEGAALTASCDPCTQKICQADAYCCATSWDRQCVSEVASICNASCSGSSSGSSGSGGGNPGCTHGVCLTGAPLLASCGPCTQKVCQHDGHCCQSGWDASCVQEAVQLCGKHCQ